MNLSAGKFFSRLFGRKQHAPKVRELTVTPKTKTNKPKDRGGCYHGPSSTEHNDHQAYRAKKRQKGRKKNVVQGNSRKANRKGGKS